MIGFKTFTNPKASKCGVFAVGKWLTLWWRVKAKRASMIWRNPVVVVAAQFQSAWATSGSYSPNSQKGLARRESQKEAASRAVLGFLNTARFRSYL